MATESGSEDRDFFGSYPVEDFELFETFESTIPLSPARDWPLLPTSRSREDDTMVKISVPHSIEEQIGNNPNAIPRHSDDIDATPQKANKSRVHEWFWNIKIFTTNLFRYIVNSNRVDDDVVGDQPLIVEKAIDEDADEGLGRFFPRCGWLMGLLLIQSISSAVLQNFEVLIQQHTSVMFFLTMLIGAGGNAGSQSCILMLRAVAKYPDMTWPMKRKLIWKQFTQGLLLGLTLSIFSIFRVLPFDHDMWEVLAICVSLLIIIIVSTVVASVLPLLLNRWNMDPGHAGAAVQVVMDILGVTIVMFVCTAILGKGEDELVLILPEQDLIASSPLVDNDVTLNLLTPAP